MIDDEILTKLRMIQANEIRKTNKNVSLSLVINKILEKKI